MLKLFKKAEDLRQKIDRYGLHNNEVADILTKEYPNIPHDILQWFFVRHSHYGKEILTGIEKIDAHRIIVTKINLSKNDLMNKNVIDFAPFAHYDLLEINEENKRLCEEGYKEYFKNGSWDYPIITVYQNNKYLVLDGTNRFRHMQNCILFNYSWIIEKHCIYVLIKEN